MKTLKRSAADVWVDEAQKLGLQLNSQSCGRFGIMKDYVLYVFVHESEKDRYSIFEYDIAYIKDYQNLCNSLLLAPLYDECYLNENFMQNIIDYVFGKDELRFYGALTTDLFYFHIDGKYAEMRDTEDEYEEVAIVENTENEQMLINAYNFNMNTMRNGLLEIINAKYDRGARIPSDYHEYYFYNERFLDYYVDSSSVELVRDNDNEICLHYTNDSEEFDVYLTNSEIPIDCLYKLANEMK